jgi:hypothetical protein
MSKVIDYRVFQRLAAQSTLSRNLSANTQPLMLLIRRGKKVGRYNQR